ncbi:MAG TPA: sulfotransferase [Anaerolineae bacterium]|nr:sulfotransferase [Anaerolineae bacterium]
MKLPNFLIVGAIKSGTTALYQYLIQHPEIFLSPDVKESRFLTGVNPAQNPEICELIPVMTEITAYAKLFEKAKDTQLIGEIDPWYLYLHENTIPRIQTYLDPSVKIIMCLRNPVDRNYSHYNHVIRHGWEIQSYEQLHESVVTGNENHWYERTIFEAGLYYPRVRAYLNAFSTEQVLVILYDDFRANSLGIFKQICAFIGVDNTIIPDMSYRANVGGFPRNRVIHNVLTEKHRIAAFIKPFLPLDFRRKIKYSLINKNLQPYPALSDKMRTQVLEFYRDDILKLQTLIDKDLSAWLQ